MGWSGERFYLRAIARQNLSVSHSLDSSPTKGSPWQAGTRHQTAWMLTVVRA
nr:MAG TPA: hypothetical protein [Caudoviricetes sp.]